MDGEGKGGEGGGRTRVQVCAPRETKEERGRGEGNGTRAHCTPYLWIAYPSPDTGGAEGRGEREGCPHHTLQAKAGLCEVVETRGGGKSRGWRGGR